jgi:hypothetical protein
MIILFKLMAILIVISFFWTLLSGGKLSNAPFNILNNFILKLGDWLQKIFTYLKSY